MNKERVYEFLGNVAASVGIVISAIFIAMAGILGSIAYVAFAIVVAVVANGLFLSAVAWCLNFPFNWALNYLMNQISRTASLLYFDSDCTFWVLVFSVLVVRVLFREKISETTSNIAGAMVSPKK